MASRAFVFSLHIGELTESINGYIKLVSESPHFYTDDLEILNKDKPWSLQTHVLPNDILIMRAYKYIYTNETYTLRNGTTKTRKLRDHTPLCANELYQILIEHPEVLQIHTHAKQTIALVHYWVLWDVCDKSLVHKDLVLNLSKRTQKELFNFNEYPDYASDEEPDEPNCLFQYDERRVPECTLSDEAILTVREFLRSIPNLHVECNDIWPLNWGLQSRAAHVAILKTFPNITDFNYTWNDKNWLMYPKLSWDLWKRWGIRSDNVVRYHGSDDCCYEGDCSAEARFIQVSQHGHENTTETVWRKWHDPTFQNTLQYMRLQGDELELTNTFLEEMAYLQGLVKVIVEEDELEFYVWLSGFNANNEKTLTLPPMVNLISLSLGFFPKEDPATPLNPDQTYTIYLDIQNSPNLIELPFIYNNPQNVHFIVRNKTTI